MPVASTLRELIDALQARKTNTTRLLDEMFGSRAALSRVDAHPNRADLDDQDVFVSGPAGKMPTWAEQELTGAGHLRLIRTLNAAEIRHINDWPAGNKEELRKALVAALRANPQEPLEFFWELYDGDEEDIDTSVPGQVTFRSPKSRAMLSGPGAGTVNVRVRVGP